MAADLRSSPCALTTVGSRAARARDTSSVAWRDGAGARQSVPVARWLISTSTSTTRNPFRMRSTVNLVSTPNPAASGRADLEGRTRQAALTVERLHRVESGQPFDPVARDPNHDPVPAQLHPGREGRDRSCRRRRNAPARSGAAAAAVSPGSASRKSRLQSSSSSRTASRATFHRRAPCRGGAAVAHDAGAGGTRHPPGLVGRTVVDHEDERERLGRRESGGDRRGDAVALVLGGDDDRGV